MRAPVLPPPAVEMISSPSSWMTGDAEVAAAGVDAERRALLLLGEERVDVGHRGGEVAAADARDRGDDHQRRVADARLDDDRREDRRDQQQRRRDDRPVPAAEHGDGHRVGQPQHRADERRDRDEEELARGVEAELLVRHEQHQDRPEGPDREPDVLGEDREPQVAVRDPLPGRLPERLVLGPPVVDPSTSEETSGCRHLLCPLASPGAPPDGVRPIGTDGRKRGVTGR